MNPQTLEATVAQAPLAAHLGSTLALVAASVLFAGLAITAHGRAWRVVYLVCKPATTCCIIAAAFIALASDSPLRAGILAALVLSLVGDVLLMWPWGFVPGLVAFLVGLVAYAVTFSHGAPFRPAQLAYLAPPVAAAGTILAQLWPRLGRLRLPVVFYVLALTSMAWRALARLDDPQVSLTAWAVGAAGAFCFITGDTLLARRRFLERPAPYVLELGVYYVAQWGLLLGVLLP